MGGGARSAGRLLSWAAVLFGCAVLLPSTAQATHIWLGNSVYRLFVQGTNGYRLRLSSYENNLYHRISLTAENEQGQYARYNIEGIPKDGRIDAVFPGLGEISVAMHPTKVKELPPHRGCRLPSATIESGDFIGKIQFHGEKGFTSVDTTFARGRIERSQRQECQTESAAASRGQATNLPTHFTVLHVQKGSVVVNAEGASGEGKATFEARARERRGKMGIVRVSPEVSSAGDLEANSELTHATVVPPLPFLGTATYSGPPQETGCPLPCPAPQGQLTGSLEVPLPGLGVVALTGPLVETNLYESVREY